MKTLESISSIILFNDHHFLLANKPSGIPTQEDKTGDPSLWRLLQAYCKHDLFLIHRIDRPVSGLVLFAKNKEAQAALSAQLTEKLFQKKYLAIVPIVDLPMEGSWEDQLIHDTKFNKSRLSDSTEKANKALLHYKVLMTLDHYRILEIQTETGRFHQIRAQLSSRNMPIKGDVKYGARRANKDRSIGLHAWQLVWQHHKTHQLIKWSVDPPDIDVWKTFNLEFKSNPL